MFERVGDDARASMEHLAQRVRSELAAAGLPVIAPGLNTMLAGGAEVDIDDGADTAGGVFAAWHPSPRVQECTIRAVRLRLLDDPLWKHSGQIATAMMHAMATILASAGFTVEDADNEYRPYQLRVVEGPAAGTKPMWSRRDEELAMPGRKSADPGETAT